MTTSVIPGVRVAVTRARRHDGDLHDILTTMGATVLDLALIDVVRPLDQRALDDALHRADAYAWVVFTSANAVEFVMARITELGLPMSAFGSARIAAVGPATRAALEAHGIHTDTMPQTALGDAVPDALGDVSGLRIMLPRSDIARHSLPAELRARGATVDDVAAYRTVDGAGAAGLARLVRDGDVDVIALASGSAAGALARAASAVGGLDATWASPRRPRVACIGPSTASVATELGIPVDAVADEHDDDGLARAVVNSMSVQLNVS